MKRHIYMFGLIGGLVMLLLTSCLNADDTTIELSDDTAITAFTLGTLNRYQNTTSSTTRNDTVVKTTFTGSSYAMTIDHLGGKIYNQTDLPMGTDIAHVICTISTLNNGIVGLKSLTSDSVFLHYSTDSVDFTSPRVFRVFASDGSGHRDYTTTLNVSTTTGSSFSWKQMQQETGSSLPLFDKGMRMLCVNDTCLTVLGLIGTQTVLYSSKDGQKWDCATTKFGSDAWNNAITANNSLYLLDGTTLYRSKDMKKWDNVSSSVSLKMLLGAGTKEFFGIGTNGNLQHSVDEGLTWTDEIMDSSSDYLPQDAADIVCLPYSPLDETDYMLLMGRRLATDTCDYVWRKISQYNDATAQSKWVLMTEDVTTAYSMPRSASLDMTEFKGNVLVINESGKIYQSRDQGITWKRAYSLPTGYTGNSFGMTRDADNRIWVVTNTGEVWQGMLR